MEKDYDLFERTQDGSLAWRGSVHGLENARRKLAQLAGTTTNECSVVYLPTRQVVVLANIAHTKRVVFQIAYDERLLAERANLLKSHGYEVVSDRKSTRLNSSHTVISYAVFCLKKKTAQYSCTQPTEPAR